MPREGWQPVRRGFTIRSPTFQRILVHPLSRVLTVLNGDPARKQKGRLKSRPFTIRYSPLAKLLAGGFARGFRLLLGFEVLAGHLIDRLHRQPRLAAIVEAEQLDLDLVAFLDDVGGLLHAVGRELADVDETILGAEEIYERAELHHLDHGAVIDMAELRIGGDRLDPLDRSLHRLAVVGGNLHGAVVLDIDL